MKEEFQAEKTTWARRDILQPGMLRKLNIIHPDKMKNARKMRLQKWAGIRPSRTLLHAWSLLSKQWKPLKVFKLYIFATQKMRCNQEKEEEEEEKKRMQGQHM